MRLVSISMHNYRGIADAKLTFPAGNCAVLFGVNGRGKTTVLDAVVAMLVPYVNTLCSLPPELEETAISGEAVPDDEDEGEFERDVIKSSDVRNGTDEAWCEITVRLGVEHPTISLLSEGETWKATRLRTTGRDEAKLELGDGFTQMVAHILKSQVLSDIRAGVGTHNIPIAVYYPTERTIIDVPLRIRKRHDFSNQLAAFEGALQRRSQDFKVFFEWFRDREDLENERRLDGNPDHRDRELEAVRRAVPAMLEGWGDLRVKRNPLRMEVRKVGEVLRVDQLSHGEKCVLALFADLARRLAIANPTLADPLAGEGIVLIDEIELHLHPGWQRGIVRALMRTFPNCQFVLSTHSPQVLGEVKNDQVFLLDRDERGNMQVFGGLAVFGRDANTILDTVMDVPERPAAFRARIEAIYDALAEGAYPAAREQVAQLEAELGHDEPEVTRLRTLLAGKEPS